MAHDSEWAVCMHSVAVTFGIVELRLSDVTVLNLSSVIDIGSLIL